MSETNGTRAAPAEESPVAAPNKQPINAATLTGALISVITTAMVRYEGVVQRINSAERSMQLNDVVSFGTEGRRDGQNEI